MYQDFKDAKVKVGEDDDGYKIKIKFKYFLEYLIFNTDDSPLYLFESSFENHKKLKMLIKDYEVPKFFKEDFFELVIYIINVRSVKKKDHLTDGSLLGQKDLVQQSMLTRLALLLGTPLCKATNYGFYFLLIFRSISPKEKNFTQKVKLKFIF